MILVRKEKFWGTSIEVEGIKKIIPRILIPGDTEFKYFVNHNLDINKYFDKLKIKIGSVVELSSDPDEYFFGFDEGQMDEVLGTTQVIEHIYNDGGIVFENPKDSLTLKFCDFGTTEIINVIKY